MKERMKERVEREERVKVASEGYGGQNRWADMVGQSGTSDLPSCIFVLRSLRESEGKGFGDLQARQRSGSSS